MTRLALAVLLSVPAAAFEPGWDQDPLRGHGLDLRGPAAAASAQQGRIVMRVFVAPPLDAPGLQDAVERFLQALLVARDLDAALAPLSTQINDVAFTPAEALVDRSDYWTKRSGAPEPMEREQVLADWRLLFREINEEFDNEISKGVPQPDTLPEALAKLSLDSPLVAELRGQIPRFHPIALGDRLIAFPVRRASDIAWVAEHRDEKTPLGWETALPAAVRAKNLDMRAVIAVRRYSWNGTPYALELIMLWAREPGGWRLWGLVYDDRIPTEKKSDEKQPP